MTFGNWIVVASALVVLARSVVEAGELQPGNATAFQEIRRFAAAEATQGVAVDAGFFYAVGNREIGKYDKESGRKVAAWRDADGGRFVHLNACAVIDDRLYCAHSNYPDVPMLSSIEVFDPKTLEHVTAHDLGAGAGSATWVDRRAGRWWVAFANYDGKGGEPGKGAERTSVVAFDDKWRRIEAYSFPPEVVERFRPYSNSGGAWGRDGMLYVTGHDAAEVYVLRLPDAGSVLALSRVLAAPVAGQGIAWDPSDPGLLYGIVKSRREVVVSRLVSVTTPAASHPRIP